jgi:hypothetical protein
MAKSSLSLVDQFKADFGITAPESIDLPTVQAGGRDYVFTVSKVTGHQDQVWIATHSQVFVPSSAEGVHSASIATDLEVTSAAAVLAIRAINGMPLWQFAQAMGLVDFGDTVSSVVDPLWPPAEIHRKAAEVLLNFFSSNSTFDRRLLAWVAEQVGERFAATYTLPGEPAPTEEFVFRCEGCGYVFTTSTPEDFREKLAEDGTLYCPRCSGHLSPPEGEEVDVSGSPLHRRLGRR